MYDYNLIPEHMMEAIIRYVDRGVPLGNFLTAVFANDLFQAVARADDYNSKIIPVYVRYIYNRCPIGCNGSYQDVESWIKKKFANNVSEDLQEILKD
jgi:hypothetical protein